MHHRSRHPSDSVTASASFDPQAVFRWRHLRVLCRHRLLRIGRRRSGAGANRAAQCAIRTHNQPRHGIMSRRAATESPWSSAQCCARDLKSYLGCRYYSKKDKFIILKDNSRVKPDSYMLRSRPQRLPGSRTRRFLLRPLSTSGLTAAAGENLHRQTRRLYRPCHQLDNWSDAKPAAHPHLMRQARCRAGPRHQRRQHRRRSGDRGPAHPRARSQHLPRDQGSQLERRR